MKVCSILLVVVLCVCSGALGVYVRVGHRTFPLEAVKQLKALVNMDGSHNIVSVCANPRLPQVFYPVCQGGERHQILYKLVSIPIDPCEICTFAACAGC